MVPMPATADPEPAWSPQERWQIDGGTWDDNGTIRPVTAYLAYESGDLDTLVVFAHGIGHTIAGSWFGHLEETASHGVAALAMDFRDNAGFPVLQGAEDLASATHEAQGRLAAAGHDITRVILVGVSMGGAIAGTAAAENPGLFDYLFMVEGVSVLHETWAAATAAAPAAEIAATARDGIERDAGGTFPEVPGEYVRRSPAYRAPDIAAGVQAAWVIHAVLDGLVPYDQGVQMATALDAAGVPTRFTTVLRNTPGEETGTSLTGHAALIDPAIPDINEETLSLAGHGSEAHREHAVIDAAFQQLFAFIHAGDAPVAFEAGYEDRA